MCHLLYYITVLFKVLYYTSKDVYCFVFTYYLCEKSYKSITEQYYIANCVGWVDKLIFLDKFDLRTWLLEGNLFLHRELTVCTKYLIIPDMRNHLHISTSLLCRLVLISLNTMNFTLMNMHKLRQKDIAQSPQ